MSECGGALDATILDLHFLADFRWITDSLAFSIIRPMYERYHDVGADRVLEHEQRHVLRITWWKICTALFVNASQKSMALLELARPPRQSNLGRNIIDAW